ncbi:MAG TPA: hypothetical protein VFQ24_16700 [Terriglobia bacterium]|nr:hypothetical protein [Terriglobia bacterium]
MALTAEELLAGGAVTHEVEIPVALLGEGSPGSSRVALRPLTVRDLQKIASASRDDETLSAALMIQQALVDPALKFEQVSQLAAGLARFLVDQINAISGVNSPREELQEAVQAPLARACFVLAREFGWTPEQVSAMTIGQILLYLEMSQKNGSAK